MRLLILALVLAAGGNAFAGRPDPENPLGTARRACFRFEYDCGFTDRSCSVRTRPADPTQDLDGAQNPCPYGTVTEQIWTDVPDCPQPRR